MRKFEEKPRGDGAWTNGGFFVLSPEIARYLDGDATVWEQEPMPCLARDGQLSCYRHDGFWQAMDTLRDRNHLEELWASGEAPWRSGSSDERRHRPVPRSGPVEPSFWQNRRVLLTGHTGFKGAWLALWLQSLGAAVIGFSDCVPTEPSLYELARVGEAMENIVGDIRDPEAVAGGRRRRRAPRS